MGPSIGVDAGTPWYRRDWITNDTIPPLIWVQNDNPMISWAFKNLMIRVCGHLTQPVSHDIRVTQVLVVNPVCSNRSYNVGGRFYNNGNVLESYQANLVIVNDTNPSDTVFTSTTSVSGHSPYTFTVGTFIGWLVPPDDSTTYRLTVCAPLPGDNNPSDNCLDMTTFARFCPGVEESTPEMIPRIYSLSHNNPNPMGSSTTIRYEIPKEGYVSLKIYDLSGRVLNTLVEEIQKAGYYSMTWDGRNSRGEEVGSGIYFYQLKGGVFQSTKKLVLIR